MAPGRSFQVLVARLTVFAGQSLCHDDPVEGEQVNHVGKVRDRFYEAEEVPYLGQREAIDIVDDKDNRAIQGSEQFFDASPQVVH